jgi:hypothetical protein
MLRRLIIVTCLAAGMCITAVMTLATPALAKGPSQARIMGPGLAHGLLVTGNAEPGQLSALSNLAWRTELFTVLFGPGGGIPARTRLRKRLPAASLGAGYTVVYTVPGVTPRQGERFGRIRQVLYPLAKGGPVIYTPPRQMGFIQPVRVTGWMRGGARLASTLAKLGVPPRQPSAAQDAARDTGGRTVDWLVGSVVVVAAAALAGVAWRLRQRRQPGRAGLTPPS